MDRWKQCMKFFFMNHLGTYRMLAVGVISAICMDIYARPIRKLCEVYDLTLSLWGMPIFWNRRHVPVLFLLIFLFAIAHFPLNRRVHQYFVSRLGVRIWILFQSIYLLIYSGLYIIWCYALFVITLCPRGSFSPDYYQGWWKLSKLAEQDETGVLIRIPQEYLLSHGSRQANLEFMLCLWLVLFFICMIVLLFNQIRSYLGDIIACFVILSGLSNKITGGRMWFSPMHFLSLSNRYSALHPENPQYLYMILILVVLSAILYILAESWICSTQENNRRVN